MPRATRYLQDGFIHHLTHRCHDGEFFLRFAKERDVYREWLRVGALRHKVPVLGYAITGNHVHVIAEVRDRRAVGDMMKLASGATAQALNRRKGHEDSVWEHPYQCTRVQDGRHLLNCLRYVDMNMVRAGKISHPSQWRWCGYDELTQCRERYRIIDQDRLLFLAGFGSMDAFAAFYAESISDRLAGGAPNREPCWTEAVAVGDRAFVEVAERTCSYRRSMESYELPEPSRGTWIVRERGQPYACDSDQETDS